MTAKPAKPPSKNSANFTVAVRALCEFAARQGDLDLRFTPAPSAQDGIDGHLAVQSRRAADYQSEVTLEGQYQQLTVRGRADGYDPIRNQLEEIKTHRGDLERMPDNHRQLHWAQARTYAWLMCQKLGLSEMRVALVYYDVASRKETVLLELHSASTLRDWFEQLCQRFLYWADQEVLHRRQRNAALQAMKFPHADFRAGQRQLAEMVYKAASGARCLMAQAPTGIGKTIGTIFPLLKAMPVHALDKLFFLSAKTVGRALALDALGLITDAPLANELEEQGGGTATSSRPAPVFPLRVLELVARDKACEYPDKACHGESCTLAKGFYDRLPAARRAAAGLATMDQQSLRSVALENQVCPYYLGQEMARWSDVVVGDYNYYFDLHAMLFAMAQANDWRTAVLVDEAHNLLERGRKMYTATLEQSLLVKARRSPPAPLRKTLTALSQRWKELVQEQQQAYEVHASLPDKFRLVLQKTIASITDYMGENPAGISAELQQFYFDALHFSRLAELFDDHSMFDISLQGSYGGPSANALVVADSGAAVAAAVTATATASEPTTDTLFPDASENIGQRKRRRSSTLCLRNLVPGPFLQSRFAAAHCSVLFSATLSPWHFYSDMLGMPQDSAWVDIPPSFQSQQLAVKVVSDISTRYQHRDDSLLPIADLIAAQYARAPGNYLAFFGSFEYLQKAVACFIQRHPSIPVWQQSRHMDEAAREQFLARFSADGHGIGFAVLGGVFGEGIDLPGRRLIGAFIATLGLPQLNPVNEQIRERMELRFGAGYDYTYFYPGLQKVVQAAGRVIRSESDTGVLYLMDDRFARADARVLYPSWWKPEFVRVAQ